jgi:hypothetical protein
MTKDNVSDDKHESIPGKCWEGRPRPSKPSEARQPPGGYGNS